VNDLGAGGVFFNSSNDLEIGTILDLKNRVFSCYAFDKM